MDSVRENGAVENTARGHYVPSIRRGRLVATLAVVSLYFASPGYPATITTFDGPGGFGTTPWAVTPAGLIVGTYWDGVASRGFLRESDGTITTFGPPAAVYTYVLAVTPAGLIVGSYADADTFSHGFLRERDGTITTFDVPGAVCPLTSGWRG